MSSQIERAVIGTLIETGADDLPPSLAKLIEHAEHVWTDQRLGAIAKAVRDLRRAGQPVHLARVREQMNGDPRGLSALVDAAAGQALPVGLAEIEAQTIWTAYQNRQTRRLVAEALAEIDRQPDAADAIASVLARGVADLTQDNVSGHRFSIRGPDDILAMTFSDDDIILGDRLLARGQPLVIAGSGGIGKSRLLLQLAACVSTGRKFLVFPTAGQDLRWLILQTENSCRRLQQDLNCLHQWLGDQWPQFASRVVIHSLEHDSDGFVALDQPDNLSAIQAAIEQFRPDIIAADPLVDFSIGDPNKDADMRATLSVLSRTFRHGGGHSRCPIVLHHALTGRAGALRATGYDRTSFARNSKALFAWTRAQINLAPVDPESNDRLIVSCGKCSNGREFLPFAIRLNDQMIYEPDPSVDVAQWAQEISGQGHELMTPERVRDLCRGPMAKADLAKAIGADCGCSRSTAYRHIDRAQLVGKIQYSKDSNLCLPR